LVCLSKANHTYRVAARAGSVAVHRLAASDHDVAELFGEQTGDEIDKFARCAWTEGPGGVPLLERAPAVLVGDIEDRLDLGDHEGLLLRPTHVWQRAGVPVLMFSAVRDLSAGHPV
jgi:flavin reductase (DIM6/NTAB) family NADH-FMN oxidoreductase RutF